MNNQPAKYPDAKQLLSECLKMPELIHTRVGVKYAEQAAYFMTVETSYVQLKKDVEKLLAFYNEPVPGQKSKASVIKMYPDKNRPEPVPGKTSGSSNKQPEKEAPIIPVEEMTDEINSANALKWVEGTMEFIDIAKKSFDSFKRKFNDLYEEVKEHGEYELIRQELDILIKLQNPHEVKNPSFIDDLKKGGFARFGESLKVQSDYIASSQLEFDELFKTKDAEFFQYETLSNMIDNCYTMSAKFYKQILENATDDYENSTASTDIHMLQMKIVNIFIQQKNMLDGFRFHIQKLIQHTLNLLYIKSIQQNMLSRVHSLNALLLNDIFFNKD